MTLTVGDGTCLGEHNMAFSHPQTNAKKLLTPIGRQLPVNPETLPLKPQSSQYSELPSRPTCSFLQDQRKGTDVKQVVESVKPEQANPRPWTPMGTPMAHQSPSQGSQQIPYQTSGYQVPPHQTEGQNSSYPPHSYDYTRPPNHCGTGRQDLPGETWQRQPDCMRWRGDVDLQPPRYVEPYGRAEYVSPHRHSYPVEPPPPKLSIYDGTEDWHPFEIQFERAARRYMGGPAMTYWTS